MVRAKIIVVLGLLALVLASSPFYSPAHAQPPLPDPATQRSPKGLDIAQVNAAPPCDEEKIKDHLWNKPFRMPADADYTNPALYCKLTGMERRYAGDGAQPISRPVIDTRSVQVTAAAPQVDPIKSYSILYFNCLPSCDSAATGLIDTMSTFSAGVPWLNAGLSWSNYNYSNRLHFGVENINNCPGGFYGYNNIAIGLLYGKHLNGTVQDSNMRVFVENFWSGGCWQDVKNTIPWNPNVGMLTHVWTAYDGGTYAWLGTIWYGGGWFYVMDIRGIPAARATWIEIGQELSALNGDKQNMHIPLNFAHKNRVVTAWPGTTEHSFHDWVLPSIYQDKTIYVAEAPFSVTDIVGDNWTSISSEKP